MKLNEPNVVADPIEYYARNNNLPVELIRSIIKVVSGFNNWKNDNGKYGLMQITEVNARNHGLNADKSVEVLYDPAENVLVGCEWLRFMRNEVDQNPNDWGPLIRLAYKSCADEILADFRDKCLFAINHVV